MTKKQQGVELKKIKKWVAIIASKEFNNAEIGETYVESPENKLGSTIELNLMLLTNDAKKQSHNVMFKITEFKNGFLYAEFVGYNLQRAQLKRTTKPGKLKVEDSFAYATKDNVKVRVKPIFITKAKTVKSKLTAIRKASRDVLHELSKNITYSQMIKDIVSGNLQRELRAKVNKVYPLASCIIKSFEKL